MFFSIVAGCKMATGNDSWQMGSRLPTDSTPLKWSSPIFSHNAVSTMYVETSASANSLFFGKSPAHLPYDGKRNERRLNELLHQPLRGFTKLRVSVTLFPLLLLALAAPTLWSHLSAPRIRCFFNETADARGNFYGFPVVEGKAFFSANDVLWFFIFYYLYRIIPADPAVGKPRFRRLEYSVDGLYIIPVSAASLLAVLMFEKATTSGFPEEKLRFIMFILPRISLTVLKPFLLTLLQEVFPKHSRGFATALHCAADTVLNCVCYFCANYGLDQKSVNLVTELGIHDLYSPIEMFMYLVIGGGVIYYAHKIVDPPYTYVNNEKDYQTHHKDDLDLLRNWQKQKYASFKLYWGVDITNVKEELIDELKEEYEILYHGPFSKMFYPIRPVDVFSLQLACCIIQLPVVLVLGNLASLFRQIGYTAQNAQSSTETIYVLYTVSSLLALFMTRIGSMKNGVIYSGTLSFIIVLLISVSLIINAVSNNVNLDILFWLIAIFICLHGAILVPRTWTIVGDLCGKHRMELLFFIVLCNGVITLGLQTVLENFGWNSLLLLLVLLHVISLGLFSIGFKEEEHGDKDKENTSHSHKVPQTL